ncbi:ERCC4 domain-containing protein [Anaerotignum sp. MB30-C6]|uniref:ERCC4 domain-containing protein n=1 Tax=Anaerotignum sp. MB30-C6 TaxID=3070814 RepID=UPI0027DC8025|nr:ERCC4 domain-containing protein [Anaerotignum sp. MB30-C6]WMI80935.1 ERCC4 domain-containing protein [Anaerotignum sp. MB30-C6]
MVIVEDKGQKEGKHELKHKQWDKLGVAYTRQPLPCGDYIALNEKVQDVISRKSKQKKDVKKMDLLGTHSIAVDTKKDILEIITNVVGKSHGRFRDELILAQNNGIKLFVLIENADGVTCINDLYKWYNWRLKKSPKATTGRQLAKILTSMEYKYGVKFEFCKPEEAGLRVIELLGGE